MSAASVDDLTTQQLADYIGERIAPWPLRLPIVRHIRAMRFCYRVNTHYQMWASMGAIGGWTDTEKAWHKAIWRGEA